MDCPPPFTVNESSQGEKVLEGQNRLWVGCDKCRCPMSAGTVGRE